MAMNVLFCNPTITAQADAPYISRLRVQAMISAGLQADLLAFPERNPADPDGRLCPYRSVERRLTPPQQRWWTAAERRFGAYWRLTAEALLVTASALSQASSGYDILYFAHTEPWILRLLLSPARRSRLPPTVAVIPYVFWTGASMRALPLRTRLRGWLNQRILQRLPRHVALVFQHPAMVAASGLAASPRVRVIPEGHEDLTCRYSATEARRRLGLPPEERVLLLFGAASRIKRSDLVLQALETLPPSFTLCIVGETGGLYESTWGDIERPALQPWRNRLRVIGRRVPDEEMHDYFAASDAVILPYRQGHPTSSGNLRLAVEHGKAVIASDQHSLGDVVGRYRLGWLYIPDDLADLRRCLADFAQRPSAWFAEIRENCRKLVAEVSWAAVGRQYRELFEELIAGSDAAGLRPPRRKP